MHCLEKSYGTTELQDFEQLEDAVFYTYVFNPEVVPKMVFSTENSSGNTKKTIILFFLICRLQRLQKLKFFPSVTASQSLTKL